MLRRRQRRVARAAAQPPLELGHPRLEPLIRLDQLADPQEQRDRRLPVAIEDRLRLGPLHTPRVRRTETGPSRGGERLRERCHFRGLSSRGQDLNLRPPGYEPPRSCTRMPPCSAETPAPSQFSAAAVHLGGTPWHRRGSPLLAERLQPRRFCQRPTRVCRSTSATKRPEFKAVQVAAERDQIRRSRIRTSVSRCPRLASSRWTSCRTERLRSRSRL
jgi:hypothetical protein